MSWRHISKIMLAMPIAFALAGGMIAAISFAQGSRPLSVQSGSMAPTFHKGDLVITKPVPDRRYAVGDIVTFINPKNKRETITHRIVAVPPHNAAHSPRIITKGDANKATDGHIPIHLIVGKVELSLPYAGYIFDFLRRPVGLLLVIYIPALTIIVSEIRRLAKYYKELEPYLAAGFDPNSRTTTDSTRPANVIRVAKAGSVATIAIAGLTAPIAHAALISSASLTDSSVSTISTPGINYPLISNISFGSAGSNSGNTTINVINNNPQSAVSGNTTVNSSSGNASTGNATNTSHTSFSFTITNDDSSKMTVITLYNPTNAPIDISGWTLTDNELAHTLPSGAIIAAHASYNFTWPSGPALSRASDRLVLRNNLGVSVDALSWGDDSSQLNPSIMTTSATNSLTRPNPQTDTDTATDWQAI